MYSLDVKGASNNLDNNLDNNSISFLDIKINRNNNRFLISVYYKPTFSGVFTNFDSYIPLLYKSGLISSLLYRAFKLCSNFEIFHQEIIFLKDIFKRNGYPSDFIDKCVKTFLDKSRNQFVSYLLLVKSLYS